MVQIIITFAMSIAIFLALFVIIPYKLWELRFSFLWWVLLIIISSLICILFPQIYPVNFEGITFVKAFFSVLIGGLLFCMVWVINSFEKERTFAIVISLSMSVVFKGFGAYLVAYGVYSFIYLVWDIVSNG